VTEKKYALIVLSLFCILILVSLGDPGMILEVGQYLSDRNLEIILALIPYAIIGLILAYLTFVVRERHAWRFIFLIFLTVALFFVMRLLSGADQKIHLLIFAVLGGIVSWAAGIWGFSRASTALFILGVGIFTTTADEMVQAAFLVSIFEIRHIAVNLMSTLLGGLVYAELLDSSRDVKEDT
jgi:hypothetical protein